MPSMQKKANQQLKRSRKSIQGIEISKGDNGDWIYSYSDVMTLLLCFFILFFNVDKPSVVKDLKVYFDQFKGKNNANAGEEGSGNGEGSKASTAKSSKEKFISAMAGLKGLETSG